MSLRSLTLCLCTVALLVATPAFAGDVNDCAMVAEGRAKLISFDAQMADGTRVDLKAILTGPEGTGPVPAGGPGGPFPPFCYRAVVERFASWGLATLMVAPMTARDGNGNQLLQYSFADLATYARGAASMLAAMPQIDPARIGLWGHSHGGLAVIDAISSAGGKRSLFWAAIAAAPYLCPAKAVPPTIPLLIVIGTKDTESSVNWCVDYAARLDGAGGFEFSLIPNAGHSYWAPGAPEYNEYAAKLAENRLRAFLAQYFQAMPRLAD